MPENALICRSETTSNIYREFIHYNNQTALDRKKAYSLTQKTIKVIVKQTYHFKTFIIIVRSKTTLT